MTKSTFAKGVSKVVPVIGGVVSGGITLVTMPQMGKNLISAFETLCFSYSDEALEQDIEMIRKTVAMEIETEDIMTSGYKSANSSKSNS